MAIPFVDIARSEQPLVPGILARIRNITNSSTYILGGEVSEFETEFARYLGVNYCIGVANGTDAIAIGLAAIGIRSGDEVIGPAMTFISSMTPVISLGGKIVLVDIERDSPVIDVHALQKAITKRTKAIIAVHLHGIPANMKEILSLAKSRHIAVIEDACQAHGSVLGNGMHKKAGTAGILGAFSFYPAKNLGCWGDGGAIVTDNITIATAARLIRSHGQERKNYHVRIGMTSRLDTVQAAVLIQKLPHLDDWNRQRERLVRMYLSKLAGLPLELPGLPKYGDTNYHVFAVFLKNRDSAMEYLKSRGVETHVHYPFPLHHQPAMAFLGYKKTDFPNAIRLARESLSLPLFPGMQEEEIDIVAGALKDFFHENKKTSR